MRKGILLGAVVVVAISATAAWQIQHEIKEVQAGLLAQATISPEQARETALAAVPGGTIVDAEIEEEDGRLIYAFDIKVAGQRGTHDVEIDARTGALLQDEAEDEDDDEDDDRDDDEKGHKR